MLVDLTKKEIEESPAIETHAPVSNQYEGLYNGYYGFPELLGWSVRLGRLSVP